MQKNATIVMISFVAIAFSITVAFGDIAAAAAASNVTAAPPPPHFESRRGRRQRRPPPRRSSSATECVLYRKDVQLEGGSGEESWSCEFTPEQMKRFGLKSNILDIEGVAKEEIESMSAVSGASIMKIDANGDGGDGDIVVLGGGGDDDDEGTFVEATQPLLQIIDGGTKLKVMNDAKVAVETMSAEDVRHSGYREQQKRRERNLADSSPGTLKTLVVRVTDSVGVSVDADTAQLVDDIFEDDVSLRTQYAACSKDQLLIEPASDVGDGGTGIVDVTIGISAGAAGTTRSDIQSRALAEAEKSYGGPYGLAARFDLVLFCLPPSGDTSWIAFAYTNRWDSYYNDHWCQSVSAQMHEVGHNLGLSHSGEGDEAIYGDEVGMMGYSYNRDDDPKKCFNAAKNYQLGWYDLQKESIDPLDFTGSSRSFVLNGINDYKKDGTSNGELITLRLENEGDFGGVDYYIGYNRATGPNEGTQEARDQVTLIEKENKFGKGREGSGQSRRISGLSVGESFTIHNYKGTASNVSIKFESISEDRKDATIVVSTNDSNDPTLAPTLACGGKTGRFQVDLVIDNFGTETSWTLKKTTTEDLIASGGPDEYFSNTAYTLPAAGSSYCLEERKCYTFVIKDGFGDGICCQHGHGYYRGRLDGISIFEGGEFLESKMHQFCVTPSDAPSWTPTVAPTQDPTKAPSMFPTLKPTKATTINSPACKDNQGFRFKGKNKKTCIWVGKIWNKTKKRCKKTQDGIKVFHWCPATCAEVGLGPCAPS